MAGRVSRALGPLRTGRRDAAPAALAPAQVELARTGAAPLSGSRPDPGAPLRIAVVIPSFRRGSGGHATIVNLLTGLRGRGHSVSAWLEDCDGRHAREPTELTRRSFETFFAADGIELHTDFGAWDGADVVLATGWQTVARVLLLAGAGARAYLVQDHEPDFYGVSAESLWAAQTYRERLHCIAASPWLASLLRSRYGASATHFDLAVDHAVYRPTGAERRDDLVVFYARAVTPRRAVPLGLLALDELSQRVAGVELALFGEGEQLRVPFRHRHLGVIEPRRLAELYSQASVGMVLSLTNPSLIGLEMMACGLPCVELESDSMLATFGTAGPLELAAAEPLALCAALERLLADPGLRADASRAGIELMAPRTWARAAEQVEAGLRAALAAQV